MSSPFSSSKSGGGGVEKVNPFSSGRGNGGGLRDRTNGTQMQRKRSHLELLKELKEVELETLSREDKLDLQAELLALTLSINNSLAASGGVTVEEVEEEEERGDDMKATEDLGSAPVWTVPESIRTSSPISTELHAKLVGLDDLFPNSGLGKLFNSNGDFRTELRTSMRKDLYIIDPTLSRERNLQMQSLSSTLHVVWNRSNCTFRNTTMTLSKYGVELTGSDLILTLGGLSGGEATSGSLLEIVNITRRKVNHSWHQDSGRAQRTVMLGFPPEDNYCGAGVFSHGVKLSHEIASQGKRGDVVQYDQYDPYPGDIPEEFIVRPMYKQGAEVLVYYDNAHLHATPDVIHREAIWRFM